MTVDLGLVWDVEEQAREQELRATRARLLGLLRTKPEPALKAEPLKTPARLVQFILRGVQDEILNHCAVWIPLDEKIEPNQHRVVAGVHVLILHRSYVGNMPEAWDCRRVYVTQPPVPPPPAPAPELELEPYFPDVEEYLKLKALKRKSYSLPPQHSPGLDEFVLKMFELYGPPPDAEGSEKRIMQQRLAEQLRRSLQKSFDTQTAAASKYLGIRP